MPLLLGFVNNRLSLVYKTYNKSKMSPRGDGRLALPNRTPKACARTRYVWKYHARQGEESHPQAQTPAQDQRNAIWPAPRNSGVRPLLVPVTLT